MGKKQWLNQKRLGHCCFWPKGDGMSFWSSLFGGQNPTLNQDIAQFGQIGGFATNLGESNLSQASQFWSSLLSGDQSKIAKTLTPEINTIQQQGAQQRATTAQFGNRGGGTNAAMQMVGDTSRASINDMIAKLLGSSASNLASTGGGLLGTAVGAFGAQEAASQQRMRNWANSILGHGITTSFQTGEELGEQYLTGGTSASNAYPSGGLGN
jgi:hypothetical protein